MIYHTVNPGEIGETGGIPWQISTSYWAPKPPWESSWHRGEPHCKILRNMIWLVGGLEHFLFFHVLGIVTATDFHIFQRGRAQPPTSWVLKWHFNGTLVTSPRMSSTLYCQCPDRSKNFSLRWPKFPALSKPLWKHEKVPKLELLHHILTYLGGISPYISLLQALHIVPPILLLPKSHAQQTSCHQRHPGAIHGHCDQQWWRWSLGCGQKLAGDPTGAGRRPSCWDGVIPWDPLGPSICQGGHSNHHNHPK